MLLSRAMIIGVEDLEKVLVPCPEWGGDVYVRVLMAREREVYEEVIDVRRELQELRELQDKESTGDADDMPAAETLPPSLRIPLVRMATCNAEGDALFTKQDDEWLSGKSHVVTTRIFDAAWTLNKLGRDAQADVKKNLDVSPAAALNTDLPLLSA